MQKALGVLVGVAAVLFGLVFLDVFVTKLTSGDAVMYVAMVTYAAATYGCAVAARRLFRRT